MKKYLTLFLMFLMSAFIFAKQSEKKSLNDILTAGEWTDSYYAYSNDGNHRYSIKEHWEFTKTGKNTGTLSRYANASSLPDILRSGGKMKGNVWDIEADYKIEDNILILTITKAKSGHADATYRIGEILKYPVTVIDETEISVQKKSTASRLKRN